METILLVVFGVIVVALLIIIAVLAVILANLVRRDKQRDENAKFVLEQTISDAFKREKKKIAKMYAEEIRVAKWAKKLLEKDELDVTKLATETEQRAYVMALKKAEDAVTLAEDGLGVIRQEILRAQKDLSGKLYHPAPGPYKNHKEALRRLYKHEKVAEERVKNARKRLTLLTDSVSTTDFEEALESLEIAPAMVPATIVSSDGQLVQPAETEPDPLRDPAFTVRPDSPQDSSASFVEPPNQSSDISTPHDSPQSQN